MTKNQGSKDDDDEGMSKLGVDEGSGDQERLEKLASKGCPECGAKLLKEGGILICPTHGTAPFERRS